MEKIGVYQAKTHLPALLKKVQSGHKIAITKYGVPIALFVPYETNKTIPVEETIQEIKRLRKGVSLGGLSIRQAIEEGRKY